MSETAKWREFLDAAHDACFMERGRLLEQTCEMPQGPCTGVCEGLHVAIDRLADALAAEVERIEYRLAAIIGAHQGPMGSCAERIGDAETRAEAAETDNSVLRSERADMIQAGAGVHNRLEAAEAALATAHSLGCACALKVEGYTFEGYDDPLCVKLRALVRR